MGIALPCLTPQLPLVGEGVRATASGCAALLRRIIQTLRHMLCLRAGHAARSSLTAARRDCGAPRVRLRNERTDITDDDGASTDCGWQDASGREWRRLEGHSRLLSTARQQA